MSLLISFFFFTRSEINSIKIPKTSIPIPEIKLIFFPKEIEYMSLPIVVRPKIVRIIPRMVNIKPIGILISSPILFKFNYQNIILKIIAIIPTTHARNTGRSYQFLLSSIVFGVS